MAVLLIVYQARANEIKAPATKEMTNKSPAQPTETEVDKESALDALDYPELQVVPRASERLLDEAKYERDYGIFTHWTYWTSGALTFYAGSVLGGNHRDPNASAAEKEGAANATKFSQFVGGGSLLLAAYMSYSKPYISQLEKVQKIKGGGKRGELHKERMAEEGLEGPAKLISTLNWVIFVSNFLASGAISSYGGQNVNAYALPALLASTLPFLFKHSYITVYEKHLEYKRKIYAPLVYLDQKTLQPMVGYNFFF